MEAEPSGDGRGLTFVADSFTGAGWCKGAPINHAVPALILAEWRCRPLISPINVHL